LSAENTLVLTSQLGEFSVLLLGDRAPVTCEYFRNLARTGALDDASVFRIVADCNEQPGDECPIQIVQVGPLQNLFGERHPIAHESTKETGLSHLKWTVSAARFESGELYGSFFVCMRDEPELDFGGKRQADGQGFAAFGRVVEGFETLKQIFQRAETDEMLTNRIPIQDVALVDKSSSARSGYCYGE